VQNLETISNTERSLRTFENKVWRIICGPVYDNKTGAWRRKFNWKLQDELRLTPVSSFISGQRIQWFGNVMRRKIRLEWCWNGGLQGRGLMDGLESDGWIPIEKISIK
jgi:hypothetical protein